MRACPCVYVFEPCGKPSAFYGMATMGVNALSLSLKENLSNSIYYAARRLLYIIRIM
jgi:hypothetical protein